MRTAVALLTFVNGLSAVSREDDCTFTKGATTKSHFRELGANASIEFFDTAHTAAIAAQVSASSYRYQNEL